MLSRSIFEQRSRSGPRSLCLDTCWGERVEPLWSTNWFRRSPVGGAGSGERLGETSLIRDGVFGEGAPGFAVRGLHDAQHHNGGVCESAPCVANQPSPGGAS